MRDLLDAENWDGLIISQNHRKGRRALLDVNVDFVGRDGVADMHELAIAARDQRQDTADVDSTEWEKMEAGLEHAGGKCISTRQYEDGEPRFLKVLSLAKERRTCRDRPHRRGRDAERRDKIRIAPSLHAGDRLGIPAHDIFFDPLALPISTGIEEDRKNADETIKAREIRAEMPREYHPRRVNISFGLARRRGLF